MPNVNLTLDKTSVGLGNVDNTSDANKPISTAQQAALDLKLDASAYGAANTDALPEGSSNLYFLASRVRAVVLTGLSTATNAAITASDSVLSAFGKIQAQLNALGNASTKNVGTAANTVAAGDDYRFNYWLTLPGSPTRVSNNSFTITDTGNANLYDKKFGRTTVFKWTDSGVTKMAMVHSASYSSNTVTFTLNGDTLSATATMSSFTYTRERARKIILAVAGTLGTGTNLSAALPAECSLKIFGADVYVTTAGTTGSTTFDINKNGTTMFTTKPSVASGATSGTGFTADSGTTMAALVDIVTLDIDAVSTTAPVDAYAYVYVLPLNNQYL